MTKQENKQPSENAKKFLEYVHHHPHIQRQFIDHLHRHDEKAIEQLAKEQGLPCTFNEVETLFQNTYHNTFKLTAKDLHSVTGGSNLL